MFEERSLPFEEVLQSGYNMCSTVRAAHCPRSPGQNCFFPNHTFDIEKPKSALKPPVASWSVNLGVVRCYQRQSAVWEQTDEWLRAFTVKSSRLSALQNFTDIQSWMYLSRTATAEGHNSDRGSGFQAYTLRLMPLNLYMCQWLWSNRVTAQLALNKHSTMLACFSLLFEMTPGLLTCQGGGSDAKWVVVIMATK